MADENLSQIRIETIKFRNGAKITFEGYSDDPFLSSEIWTTWRENGEVIHVSIRDVS